MNGKINNSEEVEEIEEVEAEARDCVRKRTL